jgi:pSer/pThr/pTyr-binding forkhead associated (FHA) protein
MTAYPPRGAGADVREPSPRGAAGPHILDNLGEIYLLDRPVLTIGAARENDVIVRLPGVSRQHARIVREGGGTYWLEDVGSRYGSTVNGMVVTRARLWHGDEIAMGGWRATVNLT